MTSEYPYDIGLLKNDAGAREDAFAQSNPTGIHAGASNLYTSAHAPSPLGDASSSGLPPTSSYRTPTSFDQADLPRDGARATPPVTLEEKDIAEAREDGAVSPKARGWSRRNLIIGLFISFVILGGVLGGALGATLGKHSSSNAATKTSSSAPPSSTTSSISSGGTLSGATTATTTSQVTSTATTTSTTTTTSPNSPPLITPGVTYTITNSATGTLIDLNQGTLMIAGWQSNGGQNQRWLVETADGGSWYISSATGKGYITFQGNQARQTAPLVVVAGTPTQSWIIESNANSPGSVRIHYPDASLNLSVDLNNAGGTNGNPITLWADDTSGAQTWLFNAVV